MCHTEDALTEDLNHFYFVACDIDGPNGTKEKFTSLCYAGHLPGYTMGYNQHGLVYSINTIQALNLRSGKTREILFFYDGSIYIPMNRKNSKCCRLSSFLYSIKKSHFNAVSI